MNSGYIDIDGFGPQVKEKELIAAEDSLESFQIVNRGWASTSDPILLKKLSRNKRDVLAKLNTYKFLKEQLNRLVDSRWISKGDQYSIGDSLFFKTTNEVEYFMGELYWIFNSEYKINNDTLEIKTKTVAFELDKTDGFVRCTLHVFVKQPEDPVDPGEFVASRHPAPCKHPLPNSQEWTFSVKRQDLLWPY